MRGSPPASIRPGDLGSLYDTQAVRIHAHCWSLLGDEHAAAAVRDTFVAAVQHPPRGDRVLWLHALSRSACAALDAFDGTPPVLAGAAGDPLLRAAADLPADHREALLLWAGQWLEVPDVARVLGIAPDTAAGLLHAARTRLERAVLDQLMRGAAAPAVHNDIVAAFEKGRLPRLLARRVPQAPPAWLRDQVLAACEGEVTRPLTDVVAPSPLVVIGSDVATPPGGALARRSRAAKGIGAVAGTAASVAAAVGLLASWPSDSSGGVSVAEPSAGNTRTDPAAASTPTGSATSRSGTPSPAPESTEPDSSAPAPSTADRERPSTTPPGGSPQAKHAPPASSPNGGGGSSTPDRTATPPKDKESTSPPPKSPSPSPTDPSRTTTPPPTPSQPPNTSPPATTPPPSQTPDPGPSPTANPTPSPAR